MHRSFEGAILALFGFIAKFRKMGGASWLISIPLAPLLLLSALFGRMASWRLAFFAKKARAEPLDLFIISVGNLTSGGSGKTPLVQLLAEVLRPLSPAVLSRGYRSRFFRSSTLISDEMGPLYPVQLCGDEPYLLALCTQAPIIIDKDRVRGAKFASQHLRARALLLDDGFQHQQLFRNCDILLIEASHIDQEPLCLPAGPQRNRLQDCAFADLVIITGAVDADQWRQRANFIEKMTAAKVVGARFDLSALTPLPKWREMGGSGDLIDDRAQTPFPKLNEVFVCCALANPQRFVQTLTRAHLTVVGSFFLPDHAFVDQMSAGEVQRLAQECGAEAIICTEKDAVKWGDGMAMLPIFVATSKWRIAENESVWVQFLDNLQKRIEEHTEAADRAQQSAALFEPADDATILE